MKRRAAIMFYALLAFILPSTLSAANLTPVKNWRARPVRTASSNSNELLNPLLSGRSCEWKPANPSSNWFSLRFPRSRKVMVTFSWPTGKVRSEVVLESSVDSSDGIDGIWKEEKKFTPSGRLDKFEFDTKAAPWWRLRFNVLDDESPIIAPVSDIAAYWMDVRGRKDYWMIIGASIQAQSIRQDVFHKLAEERYPEYDPVVFNLAVGGWRSDHLLKALPDFLKDHPNASYVGIHIGGNNVTPNRPYPGGSEQLKNEIVAIIKMIKDSGKIPILSRLSYRAYKGDKPVPPEDNGSGPYVTNIYDPIIREYCPDFWDSENNRGLVDGYNWFKDHQDELSPDGVHVNSKGAESWNRLWVEKAGSVIYKGK